ncbi:hypothetical protein C8Q78DRAFT_1099004, partial [Trametes maxima]
SAYGGGVRDIRRVYVVCRAESLTVLGYVHVHATRAIRTSARQTSRATARKSLERALREQYRFSADAVYVSRGDAASGEWAHGRVNFTARLDRSAPVTSCGSSTSPAPPARRRRAKPRTPRAACPATPTTSAPWRSTTRTTPNTNTVTFVCPSGGQVRCQANFNDNDDGPGYSLR